MSEASLSLTFVRGARRVTGSNFLVEAVRGESRTRILIDCGLAQGARFCDPLNTSPFPYDPMSVDAIVFTHAHADHIGLFPRLVNEGFRGKAYATKATKALMPIMLEDSVKLIVEEAKRCGYQPPYLPHDVTKAVARIESVPYRSPVRIADGVSVTLWNAGHIMGSAAVLIEAFGTKLLFTGDLGRTPAALVPDPETPPQADYLVSESVYGNRLHGSLTDAEDALYGAVRLAAAQKGTLLIPAFSLERTQIILDALDRGIAERKIPPMPVFMDSPLAAKVTEIYRSHPEYLRTELRERIGRGDDPFSFPGLSVTTDQSASGAIDEKPSPKVILAGAGMSHGGRIRRHEARYLPEKSTILLLVGYQVPGSLGRRLKDGERKVEIDGRWITSRAKVVSTDGFSAHADRDDLLAYAEAVKPQKVFVVLGETEAAAFLAQRISGFLGIEASVPREGESVSLKP
ncbi:MAG: MBL fold metallo-hydrolase [Patescibacteria group bacterium]